MRITHIVLGIMLILLLAGCSIFSIDKLPDKATEGSEAPSFAPLTVVSGNSTEGTAPSTKSGPPLPPSNKQAPPNPPVANTSAAPETPANLPDAGASSGIIVDQPLSSRFVVEPGSPTFMPAFMHAEKECAWMGVGGQVFDRNNQPLLDLVVLVQGVLDGQEVNLFALTGSFTTLGPGGYEFKLSDRSIASTQTLYATVYDSYGNQLSGNVYFDTSALCESNLVLINFREFYLNGKYEAYLPIISR